MAPFCGGRTDAADGAGSAHVGPPRVTGNITDSAFDVKEMVAIMGLTMREFIALNGGGHTLGRMHQVVVTVCLFFFFNTNFDLQFSIFKFQYICFAL